MAKKVTDAKISWEEAYDELNEIVASLEDETVSVDLLAEKMQRASELIEICSSRLRATEDAVNRIIREMDEPGPVRPDEDQSVPF